VGTVRDTAGTPLAGAGVLLGDRQVTTGASGGVQLDGIRPGHYALVVRLIGYHPHRSRIAVLASEPTRLDIYLVPAPVLLPAVVVEGRRTGIYGVVGDTSYRAAVGALVQVLGTQGGEAFTDSTGRFAFPQADRGTYLVRVTFPGYTERRVVVETRRGKGKELSIMLTPARFTQISRTEAVALYELDKRLTWNVRQSTLSRAEMEKFGAMPICEIPRITSVVGHAPTVVVNGTTVIPEFSLCAWRLDEVDLVEFGKEVCADATKSIADMLGVQCSGRTVAVGPRSMVGASGRFAGRGGPYVVIWEKK
jgi:hypothetical protein